MTCRRRKRSHAYIRGLALSGCACIAVCALMAGCGTSVRLPDSPPPVETDPVLPVAGFGMELRLWDLDASSWRRARTNAQLAELYEQWQEILAQREQSADDAAGPQRDAAPDSATAPGSTFGPPSDESASEPQTFEAFVESSGATLPQRPGRESFERYASLRGSIESQSESVWRRNGVEFALVPIQELAQLRTEMGVRRPLERTWWGSTTEWSRMLGNRWMEARRFETDAGPLELGAGRFGLVGRAWAAPGLSAPVLRLDLCPQFVPQRSRAERLESRLQSRLTDDAGLADAISEGAVFERLALHASVPRGYALVVAATPTEASGPPIGPAIESSTLGQALFSRPGPDGRSKPLALVIVPVLPEWYGLDGG
ncbi:MAG: hypothetical protein ACFCBV_06990 [Phycisphaerales bacterium]